MTTAPMTTPPEVRHTAMADLPFIFELFDHSILYQEKKGFPTWRDYDQNALRSDIQNKTQYKIILDGTIAIVFSISYRDSVIWRQHDTGDSLYLHRIVVNPVFKGQKLFGHIVQWAKNHIHQKALKSIRMDTWANNPTIIDYYKTFGFRVVENYTTPNSEELPVHNRNLALTLMEYNAHSKTD